MRKAIQLDARDLRAEYLRNPVKGHCVILEHAHPTPPEVTWSIRTAQNKLLSLDLDDAHSLELHAVPGRILWVLWAPTPEQADQLAAGFLDLNYDLRRIEVPAGQKPYDFLPLREGDYVRLAQMRPSRIPLHEIRTEFTRPTSTTKDDDAGLGSPLVNLVHALSDVQPGCTIVVQFVFQKRGLWSRLWQWNPRTHYEAPWRKTDQESMDRKAQVIETYDLQIRLL